MQRMHHFHGFISDMIFSCCNLWWLWKSHFEWIKLPTWQTLSKGVTLPHSTRGTKTSGYSWFPHQWWMIWYGLENDFMLGSKCKIGQFIYSVIISCTRMLIRAFSFQSSQPATRPKYFSEMNLIVWSTIIQRSSILQRIQNNVVRLHRTNFGIMFYFLWLFTFI